MKLNNAGLVLFNFCLLLFEWSKTEAWLQTLSVSCNLRLAEVLTKDLGD